MNESEVYEFKNDSDLMIVFDLLEHDICKLNVYNIIYVRINGL